MTASATTLVKILAFLALGLAIAAMGVYVGSADDAPGAAVIGFLLMLAALVLSVRAARGRLPVWAERTALAVGLVIAAFAALLTHAVTVAAPLFAQAPEVPSVASASPPPSAAAIAEARGLARVAILEQNLPGLSIAVGAGGAIVWAEGFGWRDVATRTPVTPITKFHIGSAASSIPAGAVASLGLTHTGAEPAEEWSPEHIGEPEEDFPLFTLIHNVILRPLGISRPAQPLPAERATFYVPRSSDNNPRRGRRLMYMRDLACCADGMAFYSTPSELVRFALATSADSVSGELAGGEVMSLLARRERGIVVAVASNIAHANTAALARQVAEMFARER